MVIQTLNWMSFHRWLGFKLKIVHFSINDLGAQKKTYPESKQIMVRVKGRVGRFCDDWYYQRIDRKSQNPTQNAEFRFEKNAQQTAKSGPNHYNKTTYTTSYLF